MGPSIAPYLASWQTWQAMSTVTRSFLVSGMGSTSGSTKACEKSLTKEEGRRMNSKNAMRQLFPPAPTAQAKQKLPPSKRLTLAILICILSHHALVLSQSSPKTLPSLRLPSTCIRKIQCNTMFWLLLQRAQCAGSRSYINPYVVGICVYPGKS